MELTKARICIPNTLRNWPWPRRISPHYEPCKPGSSAWCEAYDLLTPKAIKAFDRGNFSLLAGLAYPTHDIGGYRVACQLMNLIFVFDEYSDPEDAKGVRTQANVIMDAIKDPQASRPVGEWVGGEVTKEFWLNIIETTTSACQRHLADAIQLYTDALVHRAEDRDRHYIRDIQSYFKVRRNSIATGPAFALIEINLDLPEEIYNDPVVVKLRTTCTDMVAIGNDLCSYNVEQARGDDGHNLVTVVMHELHLDLPGALSYISELHDALIGEFLEACENIPRWGSPLDLQVAMYVDGLGNWVRANDSWSFETNRYFGKEGLEIQKTRLVDLLLKVDGTNLVA